MKKITTATLVLLTTVGMAMAAHGDRFPFTGSNAKHKMHQLNEHKSDLPRGFEKLNLTETQKAKIKAIVNSDSPASKAKKDDTGLRQKMDTRRAAEQKLMSNKQFDEVAARQMIVERQQERLGMEREFAERELQMLKKRHAIFQVLTPEQQKQFQEEQQRQWQHYINRKNSR